MSASMVLYVANNDKEVTVVLLVVYMATAATGILAIVLNAISLDTMVKRTRLEPTDLLMCSLAITDMLTGVLILHTVSYNLLNYQNFVECLVRLGLMFTFVWCSMYHLALLTLDRFVKIVFPFRYYDFISRRSVCLMLSVVWVVSTNVGLLPLYGWRNVPGPTEPPCSLLGVVTSGYSYLGMCLLFTPMLFMIGLYFKIFLVSRKHSRAIMALNVTSSRGPAVAMKFTKVVFILVGTYFICFTPMAIVASVYTVGGFHSMSAADVGDYIVYTSVLTFANSVVNPIIYAFKIPPVRKRFLQILGKSRTTSTSGQSQIRSVQSQGEGHTVITKIA